jgi:TetR/AcrR family tetracycline transcriptional repressor
MRVRAARAPHIEPEAVIRAALEILDSEGLEHVTLRRIASKLGVQAPALYWHFKDKQDIIDDMAQAILVEGGLEEIKRPADAAAWADWMVETAHVVRKAVLSHKDGARVVSGASPFRARILAEAATLTMQVLNDAGFDLLHAALATVTTFDYVWGYVTAEQAGEGPESEPTSLRRSGGASTFGSGMMDAFMTEIDILSSAEKFDWGLRIIVSGLKSALLDSTNYIKTKT